MKYCDFVDRWQEIDEIVNKIILDVEASFSSGIPLMELSQKSELPFNELEWRGFCLNTHKLMGVQRMRGGPYSSHPTRMAFFLSEALVNSPSRSTSVLYALFHDYLEEGDGRNKVGLKNFTKLFGQYPDVVKAAIYLSEPQLPKDLLDCKFKHLEVISYIIQIEMCHTRSDYEPLINTSIMDKIDNLHDLSYIIKHKNLSSQRISERLCEKFAIFQLIVEKIGDNCDKILSNLFNEAIEKRKTELNLDKNLIQTYYKTLSKLYNLHHDKIHEQILLYHTKIELFKV